MRPCVDLLRKSGGTRAEILTILIVVGALIAVLYPSEQWAASGEIRVPVRVLVFDAVNDQPITGARVGIFHAMALFGPADIEANRRGFSTAARGELPAELLGSTGEKGEFVLEYRFRQSSSSNHPTSRVHANRVWVIVRADDYGGVLVPVSAGAVPSETVRNDGEIVVPIGLVAYP